LYSSTGVESLYVDGYEDRGMCSADKVTSSWST
jgi:hypothetical protein